MIRFTRILSEGLSAYGHSILIIFPEEILGKFTFKLPKFTKWLRYIDKYIIFPWKLRSIAKNSSSDSIFHICDHANSIYSSALKGVAHLVTCHDMLAIRGSMGDATTYCFASRMGIILQKWILYSLRQIPYIACVSKYTFEDLKKFLCKNKLKSELFIVPNSLNANFVPVKREESQKILLQFLGEQITHPFLLHVGSAHVRKNRMLLVQTLMHLSNAWNVVFAGEGMSAEELNYILKTGFKDRVKVFLKPKHDELCALYSAAHALVFPSWSEGFGWPVIEAQACGCPVVCSNLTSLPEVAGEAAIFIPADDPRACADAVIQLQKPQIRQKFVNKGFQNTKRFSLDQFIESYEYIYNETLANHNLMKNQKNRINLALFRKNQDIESNEQS